MAVTLRHLRFDENSAVGLREADVEVWARAVGDLDALTLPNGEVGTDLASLREAVRRLKQVEGVASQRAQRARRVWSPGLVAGVALVLGGALAALGAWAGQRWLLQLAPAVLALGLLAAGANWVARRLLDRPARITAARGEALAALERLARRTTIAVAGDAVVCARGYRRALRTARDAVRASIETATSRAREADATLTWIRAANLRIARPADDAETAALASLRQRMLSEIQGAQIALSELDRREARLDARFDDLVALADRLALSERASGLLPDRRAAPPAATLSVEPGLAELEADVSAIVAMVDDARARLDTATTASATRVEALIRSRRDS